MELENRLVPITVTEINFKDIPLIALRQKGRLLLSQHLNSIKILPSEEGYPRDWRGIAHLAGIQKLNGSVIVNQRDAMEKVLHLWNVEHKSTATFECLQTFLGIIDRWDVVDDIIEILYNDAKLYLTTKQRTQNNIDISIEKSNMEEEILTKDDVLRGKEGLSPQLYDAFVLFADEDVDFATELIERMEDYGFKLCVRERDLIGGISFEHEAILKLITERCNRLVVIISPAFLRSSANAFFVNYAQALGIEQGRRKIVPCLYEHCALPPTLSFYFLLNYQRSGRLWNFWEKLKDSIQCTPSEFSTQYCITSSERECRSESPAIKQKESLDIVHHSTSAPKLSIPTKPPRKRFEKAKLTSYDYVGQINSNNNNSTPPSSLDQSSESFKNSQLELSESNVHTQSLTNLSKLQKQTHSKVDCDVTRSSVDVSNLKTALNTKKPKWFPKFLSTSPILENSTQKKTKKIGWLKKKLSALNL